MCLSLGAKITFSIAAYGIENSTCLARSGVMPNVATSRSTLLVSRNGMRFGLVSGTRLTFTPIYWPISLATSMS